jgi:dTDP-glucose pyrophosphorylase/CBS domain-containing protein
MARAGDRTSPGGPHERDIASMCLPGTATFREAIDHIDKSGKGIILITDPQNRLVGTVSDGDVRRWVLLGQSLDTSVASFLEQKKDSAYPRPVTAPVGTSRAELLQLMHDRVLRQIPLLDEQERVVDLVTMDELLPSQPLPLQAVIMAGGFGTRLRPLTVDLPKPMLPVGDRPLLEVILRQLQASGIRRVNVTTHYKAEKIIEHFGNGAKFGVQMNYVAEDTPLGTAGALGLLDRPQETLLVMNGDILTDVDLRALLDYHRQHAALLTVGVRKYEVKVPYGVVESDGPLVRKVVEKPSLTFFVNAGVYLLEPRAQSYIPAGRRFEMTDLIARLIEEKHAVACFPILEYWLDIGRLGDYDQAQQDIKAGRFAA